MGIERLPELSRETRARWPNLQGPLTGPLAVWAAILPCLGRGWSLSRAFEAREPALAALARSTIIVIRERSRGQRTRLIRSS